MEAGWPARGAAGALTHIWGLSACTCTVTPGLIPRCMQPSLCAVRGACGRFEPGRLALPSTDSGGCDNLPASF